MYWYMDIEDNYSIAIDDMTARLDIDPLQYSNFDIPINMTAYSNEFVTKLEFDYTGGTVGDSDTEGNVKDKEENDITKALDNLDFGIIERPREDLVTQKTVTYMKLTLANGQILAEGNPSDPNADINYTKTMGFTKEIKTGEEARKFISDKQLLIEVDAVLIQGATLEIDYEVTVRNNNEIDYDYEGNTDYYYYGDVPEGEEPLKATIEIIDYLNSDIIYDESKNVYWDIVTNDILDTYKGELICEDSYNNCMTNGTHRALQKADGTEIVLAREETSEPLKMNVSKLLANEDENVYDNSVEIIKIDGKTARTIQYIEEDGAIKEKSYKPGNYIPSQLSADEQDDDRVKVIITPPTGITNYITTYVIIGLIALIVIFVGVLFIKKKVLIK